MHDDLNVFAKNVVNILASVLGSNDLALCQHATPVFETFCKFHDGALFSGDPEYVQKFSSLVDSYTKLAYDSHAGPNANQWKLVGLQGLKSISASVAISTPTGQSHIQKIVPLVLSNIKNTDTDGSALVKLDTQLNPQPRKDNRRYSMAPDPPEFTGESLLLSTCMETLKHLFETTSGSVLRGVTEATVAYVLNNKTSKQWNSSLVITAAKWVPVQIRFTVLFILVDQLNKIPLSEYSSQLTLAHMISSLLSSSVNMIGLSVIDIEKQLLSHQTTLLGASSPQDLKDTDSYLSALIVALRQCIINLACHTYYASQIPDMITVLLSRFQDDALPKNGMQFSTSSRQVSTNGTTLPPTSGAQTISENEPARSIYISNILKSVSGILEITSTKTITPNVPLTINSWDGTQQLVNNPDADVRISFAKAILLLLGNDSINPDQVLPVADRNFAITSGPLGRLIGELDHLANSNLLITSDYIILNHVINSLAKNLSINGALRAAALAYSLQEAGQATLRNLSNGNADDVEDGKLEHAIGVSSVSLSTFYTIGKTFKMSSLLDAAEEEITKRKNIGLWHPAVECPIHSEFIHEIQKKNKLNYKVENPSLIATLNMISRDIILNSFSIYSDIPADSRKAIVEPLPQLDETSYSSATVSQRSTSDAHYMTEKLPVGRARSLRQLNHSIRQTPPFPPFSHNVSLNGSAIDINDPQNEKNGNHRRLLHQDTSASNETINESNGMSMRAQSDVNLHSYYVSNGNMGQTQGSNYYHQNNSYLHPNMALPLASARVAQSLYEVRREYSPKVSQLKQAASGYTAVPFPTLSPSTIPKRPRSQAGSIRSGYSPSFNTVTTTTPPPPPQPIPILTNETADLNELQTITNGSAHDGISKPTFKNSVKEQLVNKTLHVANDSTTAIKSINTENLDGENLNEKAELRESLQPAIQLNGDYLKATSIKSNTNNSINQSSNNMPLDVTSFLSNLSIDTSKRGKLV